MPDATPLDRAGAAFVCIAVSFLLGEASERATNPFTMGLLLIASAISAVYGVEQVRRLICRP